MMKTKEIANRLVALCRQKEQLKAIDELYDDHAVSKEMPLPYGNITEGKYQIMKEQMKSEAHILKIHHHAVSEPLVADHYFVVKMISDITFSDIGRYEMEELCLYKVENGKIAEAMFYYSPIQQIPPFEGLNSKKLLEEELFV